ncbi:hypothetical protein [Galactobacter valiniphilus]|uniref:hypothetical protein n=1 Tax=Galactobacter valiniphilus TaxID=2676122 RepID=UPI00373604D6
MALIAGLSWLAVAPRGSAAELAQRSHRLLEGLLDGDSLATAQLVDSVTPTSSVDTSQLDRAGAEAALGSPVRVSAGEITEGPYSIDTTSIVSGPRGSFELTIRYKRTSEKRPWELVPISFPRLAITPRGVHRPAEVAINGLNLEYPDGEPSYLVALWPSPSTTVSYPQDGGYGWDDAELGRVPASSLTADGRYHTTFSASPVAVMLPASRERAEAAVTTWINEGLTRLERTPSEDVDNAPVRRVSPPVSTGRPFSPRLRNVSTEILAEPTLTFLSETDAGLYGQPGFPSASLRGGRIKITGQWLDGTTWRDFTDFASLYVNGSFSADFSTFATRS